MLKKRLILLSVIGLSAIGFSFTHPSEKVDEGRALERSEWKNLKILPNTISDEELKGIMREFNTALGVKCSFCHSADPKTNELDFSKDDKQEKEIARHMMTMTKEINTTYFGWQNKENPASVKAVTCYTCHNGETEPEIEKRVGAPLTQQGVLEIEQQKVGKQK